MEYLPKYTEKRLFEEYPLFVELGRLGSPYTIKKLIDEKTAAEMTVEDVINYCLKNLRTTEERTAAFSLRELLESGDYQISINQMTNVSPNKPILDYVKGKSREMINGKEVICRYARIELATGGELRS